MGAFGSVSIEKRPRPPKHPLAGEGPIVNRARRALQHTAGAFGIVSEISQTEVTVITPDGLTLTLSYDPGNYVFSRVYGFTISASVPADSVAPEGVKLSHRGVPRGGTFVAARGASPSERALAALNVVAETHLATTDLVRASITGSRSTGRTLTLSPMGGAFVWVLIPPVFKATAFPEGEPARLVELVKAVCSLALPIS